MKSCHILLISLFFLFGCELYKQDTYREYYMVESYLIANSPLPFVRLYTTSPINERYKLTREYLKNAKVEVRLLKADSSIAKIYEYYGSGTYHPINNTAIVQANRMYQLYVTLQNGDAIKAITRVPGNFETVNKLQDSYIYQSSHQVEITITPSRYPGRQSFYIFTVNAVNPDSSRLTPFYYDLVTEKGSYMKSYFINSSGIINEESLKQIGNKNLAIRLPWLLVAFYGKNKIIINAIDDNLHTFLKSQNLQTGGTRFLSGEVHNANYNITGGIGIFGSMASDTNIVFIKK